MPQRDFAQVWQSSHYEMTLESLVSAREMPQELQGLLRVAAQPQHEPVQLVQPPRGVL